MWKIFIKFLHVHYTILLIKILKEKLYPVLSYMQSYIQYKDLSSTKLYPALRYIQY